MRRAHLVYAHVWWLDVLAPFSIFPGFANIPVKRGARGSLINRHGTAKHLIRNHCIDMSRASERDALQTNF